MHSKVQLLFLLLFFAVLVGVAVLTASGFFLELRYALLRSLVPTDAISRNIDNNSEYHYKILVK